MPHLSANQQTRVLDALTDTVASLSSHQAHVVFNDDFAKGLLPIASSHGQWILDSGATDHITSSASSLVNTTAFHLPHVSLPSGATTPITLTGSFRFNSSVTLKDVLCVPIFKVDLLSVGKLTDGLSCSVTFFPSWCVLQDLVSKAMIGVGKRHGDLYYLVAFASSIPTCHPLCNVVNIPSSLWHRHLGHPSLPRLQALASSFLHCSFDSSQVCNVCPLAKQTRQPFGLSSISTTFPFALIHCDIWGPNRQSSLSGAH